MSSNPRRWKLLITADVGYVRLYGCTGQSPWTRAWAAALLTKRRPVCDDSAAAGGVCAVAALYKRTLPLPLPLPLCYIGFAGAKSKHGGGGDQRSEYAGGRRSGACAASLLATSASWDRRPVGHSAVQRWCAMGCHCAGDMDCRCQTAHASSRLRRNVTG